MVGPGPGTARTLHGWIGQTVLLLTQEGLRVPCVVLDARSVWGRVDLNVSPIGGKGGAWVSAERVEKVTYSQARTIAERDARMGSRSLIVPEPICKEIGCPPADGTCHHMGLS